MAKIVGFVKNVSGTVKVRAVDGSTREVSVGDYIYAGEVIIGGDNTEVEVKYLAMEDSVTYQDAFEVLVDDSVFAELDGSIDNIDTAAGEVDIVESSSNYFIEDDVYLGVDGPQGLGIVDTGTNFVETSPINVLTSGTTPENIVISDETAPVITSSNVAIFDENSNNVTITVTATDANALTYSIDEGLDSALFSINELGEITFNVAPDYENPQDTGLNNEYHINVTVQDTSGNFTTQAITISINNVNEAPVAVDDNIVNDEEFIYENDTVTIDVLTNDTDVDAGDNPSTFTIDSLANDTYGVFSISDDGQSIVFTPEGSFDYLAVGETQTISVEYSMSDDGGLSDTATLTLNITGTNDQPSISDVNLDTTSTTSTLFWKINASSEVTDDLDGADTDGATVLEIESLYNINDSDVSVYSLIDELNEDGADINIDSDEVDGSALKITLTSEAGETVTFNWNFIDSEYDSADYNDFAYVVVDGQEISLLSLVENSVESDSGVFTYTFEEAGAHEIVFAVINDEDDVVESGLEVEYVSGGTIESVETVGYVETFENTDTLAGTILESDMIDRFGMNNYFQVIDQDTLLEAANLTDLDVTDTHTLELASIMGEDIEFPMSADAEFVFNQEGDFEQDGGVFQVTQEFLDYEEDIDAQVGDFIFFGDALDTLGVGESATLTFDIVANDGTSDDNGESNLSEAQTVTLTITGTNDQPAISAVDLVTMSESDVDDLTDYGVNNYFSLIDTATLLAGADIQDIDVNDTHTLEFANAVVGADGALYSDDAKFTGDYTTDGGFDEDNSYGVMQVTELFLDTQTAIDLGLDDSNLGDFVLYGYGIDTLGVGESTTLTFDIVANDGTSDDNGESNLSEAQTVTLSITGTNDVAVISAVSDSVSEDDFVDFAGFNNLTYTSSIDLSNVSDIDTNDTHTFALSSFEGSYGYNEVGVQVKLVQSDASFLAVYQAAEYGDANAFIALQAAFVAMVSSPLIAAMIGDSNTLAQLVDDINNATTVTEVEAVIDGTTGFALEEVYSDTGLVSVDLIAEATPEQTASLEEQGYLVINVNDNGTYDVSTPFVDGLAEGEIAELTFGYVVNDGTEDSNVSTVTLSVEGTDEESTNAAPIVQDLNDLGTSISIFDVDGGSVDLGSLTPNTTVDSIVLSGQTELNISVSDVMDINDSDRLFISSSDDTLDTIHLSDEFTYNSDDKTYTGTDGTNTVTILIEDTIIVD